MRSKKASHNLYNETNMNSLFQSLNLLAICSLTLSLIRLQKPANFTGLVLRIAGYR